MKPMLRFLCIYFFKFKLVFYSSFCKQNPITVFAMFDVLVLKYLQESFQMQSCGDALDLICKHRPEKRKYIEYRRKKT
jgi:hypothetical protein